MAPEHLAALIHEVAPEGNIVGVRFAAQEEDGDAPWLMPPSKKKREQLITGPLPSKVRLVLSNLVFVEKAESPSAMLDRLRRLAAFQNPEFYRAQAMRISTYGKPRIISCAEFSSICRPATRLLAGRTGPSEHSWNRNGGSG